MKTYIEASGSVNPIIDNLAKRIAESFNEDIRNDDFDGWEDYVIRNMLSSADIKEEIVGLASYYWDEDHKQHNAHYYVEDNGTVGSYGDEYSYRQFKNLVMKYVIHDGDLDDEFEEGEE